MVASILVLTTDGGEKLDTSPFVRHVLESCVGLFMLALGTSTLLITIRKHRRGRARSENGEKRGLISDESTVEESEDEEISELRERTNQAYQSMDVSCPVTNVKDVNGNGIIWLSSDQRCCGDGHIDHESIDVFHSHDEEAQALTRCCETTVRTCLPCCCKDVSFHIDSNSYTGKIVAFIAGIIHGVSGPGGILGIIPAMHLHNWKLACLYLLCFCVSSTTVMGIFAALYGTCSKALSSSSTSLELPIACFSSFLSVVVGVTWLTLLSLGKLDEVFD